MVGINYFFVYLVLPRFAWVSVLIRHESHFGLTAVKRVKEATKLG